MDRKIAIVTGGARGLGKTIVGKFVQNNIFTVIVGRDKKKLDETVAGFPGMTDSIICDLSNLSCIPALVNDIAKKYQHIDILVNNAGIHLKKDLLEVSDEEFQQVILTNLTSVFTLSREVARLMIRQRQGCILHISSMAAHYGIPKVIAYTAAKAGIEGMTRSMAVELSPSGIRVNCLAPGFINTDMSAAALNSDPERKHKVLSRTPMGRLGTPEDVANAAFFLVSDAAAYITGAVLPVDGGNLIGF